jgi:ABC-type amino acid transport substrate-binding protein
MPQKGALLVPAGVRLLMSLLLLLTLVGTLCAGDLPEIKERGVIRHLGVPYANFVTGSGDGLDVELVKLFAQELGVKYRYVPTKWAHVIGDLTGKKVRAKGDGVEVLGEVPIKGDIVASGLTILPWRQKIVDFSTPTFPTQVWLVARADSPLKPIVPHHDIQLDIKEIKGMLKGRSLLGKVNTCLDPDLYNLKATGAKIRLFPGSLNDLAPAVIKGEAELTLLDVADALVALEKFPGKIKVLGPITARQEMGCAFAKTSPKLREAFNRFLEKLEGDGTYQRLVRHYYPKVFEYYRDFFEKN